MKQFIVILLTAVCMATNAQTQPYKMTGPYSVIARDGEFRGTKNGSERDMKQALLFAQAGKTDEALLIINAYATTLTRLDGHDAPLCAIQCYDLVRAMTIMHRYKMQSWADMINRAIMPMIRLFDADCPYANGNWGAIVNRLRMACAIFLNDKALYEEAKHYYLHANDNGSLPRYISETGQCQETGRDQAHVQLGLEALAETCAMAWEQGDDLWGAYDNRLMKGFEYTARYNLGYDMPFTTWKDCTGLYSQWDTPGQMSRGKLWNIYQLPYDHYVTQKGMQMPYTERILKGEKPKVKEYTKLHQTTVYPAPKGAPLKHDYEVFVRPRSEKEWTRIDTYMAKVNASIGNNKHKVSEISYSYFDFTGDVFIRVVCKNKKYKHARIRPDYKGVIANMQNDSTVEFLLFQPENVSVEFDGNITDNLLIFTSKPCISLAEARKKAKREHKKFVHYPAGIYTDDTIRVASNTLVYLSGGSYFTGTFAIDNVHDVTITGRGIARPPRGYEGCHVYRSRNIQIEGLIVNTLPVGESNEVLINDVKSISHPSWGDGLNVFASSNVTYDRVFCRNSDDCTTAYATRKGFHGSVHNIVMRNSTLWADVAHAIFIGIHGNAEACDSIVGLRYENIDILGQSEPQVDYQGCMAINCGDNNTVKDVVFENIRIEEIEQGCITQVKVGFNKKYCAAPGRTVENITFRNIRYRGKTPYMSVINGYDEERKVKGIVFEDLKINGTKIHDTMKGKPSWYATSDYVPLFVGNHVEGITFR